MAEVASSLPRLDQMGRINGPGGEAGPVARLARAVTCRHLPQRGRCGRRDEPTGRGGGNTPKVPPAGVSQGLPALAGLAAKLSLCFGRHRADPAGIASQRHGSSPGRRVPWRDPLSPRLEATLPNLRNCGRSPKRSGCTATAKCQKRGRAAPLHPPDRKPCSPLSHGSPRVPTPWGTSSN
jgi:hypothetical protein